MSIYSQPTWTTRVEMAACVEVTLSHHVVQIQSLYSRRRTQVVEDVVVPCMLVRVDEEDCVRKLRVVIDDICEIYHCFMTFVHWEGGVSVSGVDAIDCFGNVSQQGLVEP